MNLKQHLQELKRFQVERLIFFTDALFAIAITLLIIEIKVPILREEVIGTIRNADIQDAMLGQWPQWLGFLISFGVIGRFWVAHHNMFLYVDYHSNRLIFLNFAFLATIVIMPYTTAAYTAYVMFNFPFLVYCLNVSATGFFQFLLWKHIVNPKNKITLHPIDPLVNKNISSRSLTTPLIFLLAGLCCFIPFSEKYTTLGFYLPRVSFVFIFVIQANISRYFKKKGLKTI